MRLGPPSSPEQTKKRRVDTGLKRTHENGENSDVLRKLLKPETYEDTMLSFPRASIISHLLKNSLTKNAPGDSSFQENGFSGPEPETHQEDSCSTSSRCSPTCLPHFKVSQFDIDRLSDEHLRAKRARVENIIRGMCHSPGRGNEREAACRPPSPREGYRENKRKQRLPQQQQGFQRLVTGCQGQKHEDRQQLKLQLEEMQRQLRQLQEKFYQIYDSTDSEMEDGNLSEDSGHSDRVDNLPAYSALCCSDNEMSDPYLGHIPDKAQKLFHERTSVSERDNAKPDASQGKAQGLTPGKHLAERLKKELNTTMSQVVDSVVKVFARPQYTAPLGFPSAQMPLDHFPVNHENFHTSNHSNLQCFNDLIIPNPVDSFTNIQVLGQNDQTEALPLVVRKNSPETTSHQHPALRSPFSTSIPFRPSSFRHPFPLHVVGYPFQSPLGAPTGPYPVDDRSSPESTDISRDTHGLRKMSSKGHHRPISPNCGGLSSSLIKSECGDIQDQSDISPFSGSTIQEGLSPNHLKKAKLMFFYTRYPSSNMLKMFFSDVKFNRCITSQLIKWFSNFREFYYIQMEKFARQAINDGVTDAEELTVSRDCELYRSLNMHYNKANDFEVPERFLKVAQITLQEFFNAIVAGKDADPSWKKAIYKVICKLDSEVPEIFKSPNCLQDLLHE